MSKVVVRFVPSPVGRLQLVATDAALVAVEFEGRGSPSHPDAPRPSRHGVLDRAARELDDYFAGRRRTFSLRLAPEGTDFQRRVWKALLAIPFGETRAYSDIARAVGSPRAVRAVGAANGKNPLAVVVPCHRVIGADGSLTGYGGGLERKRWLLRHEGSRR